MYRYEYVEAQVEGFFNSVNHREIIDQYAERGFRFITAIPTSFSSYESIKTFDLVFEIEIE
ncbi:DUF4177 domain-containing protein [Clostridium perfringens]|nr:DUF4177 domain-containing protein [Clostridium perfringens]